MQFACNEKVPETGFFTVYSADGTEFGTIRLQKDGVFPPAPHDFCTFEKLDKPL